MIWIFIKNKCLDDVFKTGIFKAKVQINNPIIRLG